MIRAEKCTVGTTVLPWRTVFQLYSRTLIGKKGSVPAFGGSELLAW